MSALEDEDCDMMEKGSGDEATPAMEIDVPPQERDKSRKVSSDVASSSSSKRRMRKDDSGISEEKSADEDVEERVLEASLDGDDGSPVEENDTGGMSLNVSRRFKVKKRDVVSDKSSPDSGHHEAEIDFVVKDADRTEDTSGDGVYGDQLEVAATVAIDEEEMATATNGAGAQRNRNKRAKRSDERYDEDRDEDDEVSSLLSSDDEEEVEDEAVYTKARPKHNWFLCPEVSNRQYGRGNHYSNDLFRMRAYGSLHMVERLELMYKMKCHEGCVNTLHFNSTGTRLVSGSDDLYVVIWDWAVGEKVLSYESGHRSNVFQAKFMPLGGDCHIVSCARDGQVRLAELSTTGICKGTRKLASHRGPAHKLALELESPHTFLSCGEDGVVFEIDLRESKPDKLLVCKESDLKIPLYTIFAHPNNPYEFAVGGKDHFVRIYDKRKITEDTVPLKKFCPHHLLNSDTRANVTCLVYNYNGSELLASYNDDDIYTFDTSHSDGADYTHRYQGHRNNATVKGVNYFGPKSEFVVSGSDCGNIYLWEHETETVVQFMPGDEGGVVNCLEPHPHMPVLATSGLDDDIKIWVPSCERAPKLNGLKSTMRSNRKERDDERRREPTESVDGHMLWFLMHHLRRSARRRAREEGQSVDDSSTDDGSGGDSDDSDATPHAVQCTPS